MVTTVTVIIFIVAFISGKTAAVCIATLLSCFVPDEVPFIDEVIEIALLIKVIYSKSTENVHAASTNQSDENTRKLSTFVEKGKF